MAPPVDIRINALNSLCILSQQILTERTLTFDRYLDPILSIFREIILEQTDCTHINLVY